MPFVLGTGHLSKARLTWYCVLLVCSSILLYLFWVRNMDFFLVPSRSMEPTLFPRDYLLTLNEPEYHRGDIVVVHDLENDANFFVKRIIGLAGDRIAVYGGAVHINGKFASEPYIKEPSNYLMEEYTVADGEVFLMGDNRNHSEDSTLWQFQWDEDNPQPGVRKTIPLRNIVGKVRYRYFPLSRRGPIKSYPLTPTVTPLQ